MLPLKNRLKTIKETLTSHPFVTPPFLQNPHIQTVFAPSIPFFKTSLPKKERRYCNLPDGSQLGIDCWFQPEKEKHATVVVLSGLEGYIKSEKSHFCQAMEHKAYFYGYNVIHIKQRGEADTMHLTKSLFAADPVEDLTIALQHIINWGLKIYLAGTSGGGWAALFTLAHVKETIKKSIAGVVAMSPPANFLDTWDHVEKSKLYNRFLLESYKNLIRRRTKVDPPGLWDITMVNSIKTIRQLVETLFPHSFGFDKFGTIEEYQ